MRKKIGIGKSDFGKLIREGCYFIDKSLFIKEILDLGAEVLLIVRPRRFGKTLNLSMLKYFFELPKNEEEYVEREKLFKGLHIKRKKEFKKHFAKYPVIFLTFKDVKKRSFEASLFKMRLLLSEEIKRHTKNEDAKNIPSLLYSLREDKAPDDAYEESLRSLSEYIHLKTNTLPLILIDEYDTPIHAAWEHGYYDEMISFMRGLLAGGLKDNPHIFKGVITGILRIAKESIFSDLNNLKTNTILDDDFSDKFGITDKELVKLFKDFGLEHRLDEVTDWYNGYLFGKNTIFNPWSILYFVDENPERPHPYWANTSSNLLIKDLMTKGGMTIKSSLEKFIRGEAIESVINPNIVFPMLYKKESYVYSLMFFSGYLKCLNVRFEEEDMVCTLTIPNREVKYIFRNIVLDWFEESFGNQKVVVMLSALVNGKLDQFERLLNEFVITTLSFFDAKGKNPEAGYQAFVLGLLINLGKDYEISSNRELGYGRYDILIVPKKDRRKKAILMEMKSIAGLYKQDPKKAIDEAIEQIDKREYAKELAIRGFTDILKIVVVSDGKKVWVKRKEG